MSGSPPPARRPTTSCSCRSTSRPGTSSDPSFDRTGESLFLVEGLLGYLTRNTTERTLSGLRELATLESRLAVAFPIESPDGKAVKGLRHRVRGMLVAALGEPRLTRFSLEDVDDVFCQTGWRVSVELDTPQRYQGHRGVLIVGEPRPAC